jgi:hypothetical protein
MTAKQFERIAGSLSEIQALLRKLAEDGAPETPAAVAQLPGCLPRGYDLDSLLTVEQFALWRQKSVETIRDELPTTKGVIRRTRLDCRIHPRTYLELTLKGR